MEEEQKPKKPVCATCGSMIPDGTGGTLCYGCHTALFAERDVTPIETSP